jgi:tRNA splicing endonuclease
MAADKRHPSLRKFTPDASLPHARVVRHGDFYGIPAPACDAYFDHFAIGHFANSLLILSPFEIFFLATVGADLAPPPDRQALWAECAALFPPSVFARHYAVYHYYRCRLWVVRDGAVFGAHFALYADHPDVVHSRFTVAVLDDWAGRDGEALCASRVAWAVRKSALLVRVRAPEGADFGTPACLAALAIEDVAVERVRTR